MSTLKFGGINKEEQAQSIASAQQWWGEHKEEQLGKLNGVHTETSPTSAPPKDTTELSPEATHVIRGETKEVGKGDAIATKGSDGTWSTSYKGDNYTSKGDGTIQNSKGETAGTYDDKGNIYDKNGKLVGSGKASSNGTAAIINLNDDKEDKYTLSEAKDGKKNDGGMVSDTSTIGQPVPNGFQKKDGSWTIGPSVGRGETKEVGKGDAIATKGSDGTWSTSYKGEKYTSKGDGTIQNSKGETVGTYDDKGNIYDKNGKLVGSGKASSNGTAAIINLNDDKEDKYTLSEAKDGKKNDGGMVSDTSTIGQPVPNGFQKKDGSWTIGPSVGRGETKEVGKGDAIATKGSDGTWSTSYKGEKYTSKGDGTIQNSKGETVGTYDDKGNIYDKNGKLVGSGKASSNGTAAIINLNDDKEDKYTLSEPKDGKANEPAPEGQYSKIFNDIGKKMWSSNKYGHLHSRRT